MKLAKNVIKLIQYEVCKDLQQDDIRKIGRVELAADPSWHFFHEGQTCLFRVSPGNSEKSLEKYLQKRKVKFTKRPYTDPQEMVRKYQDLFIPVFHTFTMLGLEREDGELSSLLERFTHCFLNMSGYDLTQEVCELARLYAFRSVIAAQYNAQHVAGKVFMNIERYRKEHPDEFQKELASLPSPISGG